MISGKKHNRKTEQERTDDIREPSRQPLRIVLTVHYSPWSRYSGGGQRSTHYLAMNLASRRHDVHVIYSKSPFEKVEVPKQLPYHIHWSILFSLKSSRKSFLRPLTSVSVRRIVKELCRTSDKPVIVHANGEEAASVHKLRRRFSFGFVATPRYSGYPPLLLSEQSLSLKDKLSLWLTDWKYLHLLHVIRKADRICPPSRWAAGEIERLHPPSGQKIAVVPNGVPYEFLHIERKSDAAESILFFGRLSPDKGVDLLMNAYQKLSEPKPDLLIAGKGEEKDRLVRLVEELNINSRVRFLSWLKHEELAGQLSRAKICVFPSRNENYSLAVLSALAAGVPTVSTKTGGTPEMIREGVTGLLAEPGDPESLAKAIGKLLSDPEWAEQLGANAREDVRKNRTWDAACDQFEKIYSSVLPCPSA